jgi:hypothetical protein
MEHGDGRVLMDTTSFLARLRAVPHEDRTARLLQGPREPHTHWVNTATRQMFVTLLIGRQQRGQCPRCHGVKAG